MSTIKKAMKLASEVTVSPAEWNSHAFSEIQRTIFKGVDSTGLYETLQELSNIFIEVSKRSVDGQTEALFTKNDTKQFQNIVKHYKGNGTLFYVDADLRSLMTKINPANRPSKNEEHGMWISKVGYNRVMAELKEELESCQPNSYALAAESLSLLSRYIKLSVLVFEGKSRSVIKTLKTLSLNQIQVIPEKTQDYILQTFTVATEILGSSNEVLLKQAA